MDVIGALVSVFGVAIRPPVECVGDPGAGLGQCGQVPVINPPGIQRGGELGQRRWHRQGIHKTEPPSLPELGGLVAAMPAKYRPMTLLAAWWRRRAWPTYPRVRS